MDIIYLILSTLVGSIVGNGLASYFKEKGKNYATKQDIKEITTLQEEIKSDFQGAMETHKSQLSRITKEFELYVVKKHEHYPELYKNIELCVGKVKGLRGGARGLSFDNVNQEDITKYMIERDFTESDKQLICSDWDSNKSQAIRNLEFRLQRISYNEAEEYYRTAHNFYLLHRLFFSDAVSDKAKSLLDNIYDLWMNYDPDFMFFHNPELLEQQMKESERLKEDIKRQRVELFDLLQGELKVGNAN
ncbi:hypothetical protein [Bacillus cereus]|uniref:hypothetical protein n=1 Tax=Bacillus cereus TaxID=1396 RepID=UPI000B4C1490|nr:hypothetical protein [Bacillus cereus]